MLRVRQRLTQLALASRAGVSRQAVSLLECGHIERLTLAKAEAMVTALGARLDIHMLWNGPELDRLLDAGHAAIAAVVKKRLERWGWIVRVEVSYSRYGERGRIDLLAWHEALRILVVIEIKTDLVDVQSLLGSLDVKVRLARHVVEPFGWRPRFVVPAIIFADDRTIRRRIAKLDTLFDTFAVRGRECWSWLRLPDQPPSGLLSFVTSPSDSRSTSSPRRVRGTARRARS